MNYDILNTELRKAGYTGQITESNTDFGQSFYFTVDGVKVRISDHSVENSYRMFNERHFRIENYMQAVEYFEKIIFPERFNIIYTGQMIGNMKVKQYIRK